jgi:hypothetical protein
MVRAQRVMFCKTHLDHLTSETKSSKRLILEPTHTKVKPNVVVERLTILDIQEVSGSSLGPETGYSDSPSKRMPG